MLVVVKHRRDRAFTLIEVAVLVAILTILVTVAFMFYRRHRVASRLTEATHLTSAISEAQEAYRAETGVYASVSTTSSSYYPAASPGAFVTGWGGPCTACVSADAWKKLHVEPVGPVMYGYATIAGVGGIPTTPNPNSQEGAGELEQNMGPPPDDGSDDGTLATDPFYIVTARGDTNGDGVACTITASSKDKTLIIQNEGE